MADKDFTVVDSCHGIEWIPIDTLISDTGHGIDLWLPDFLECNIDWYPPHPFSSEGLSYLDVYFEELMFWISKRQSQAGIPESDKIKWYRYKSINEKEQFIPEWRPAGTGLVGFSVGFDNYILDMRRGIKEYYQAVGFREPMVRGLLDWKYGRSTYLHLEGELGKDGSLYDTDLDELRTVTEYARFKAKMYSMNKARPLITNIIELNGKMTWLISAVIKSSGLLITDGNWWETALAWNDGGVFKSRWHEHQEIEAVEEREYDTNVSIGLANGGDAGVEYTYYGCERTDYSKRWTYQPAIFFVALMKKSTEWIKRKLKIETVFPYCITRFFQHQAWFGCLYLGDPDNRICLWNPRTPIRFYDSGIRDFGYLKLLDVVEAYGKLHFAGVTCNFCRPPKWAYFTTDWQVEWQYLSDPSMWGTWTNMMITQSGSYLIAVGITRRAGAEIDGITIFTKLLGQPWELKPYIKYGLTGNTIIDLKATASRIYFIEKTWNDYIFLWEGYPDDEWTETNLSAMGLGQTERATIYLMGGTDLVIVASHWIGGPWRESVSYGERKGGNWTWHIGSFYAREVE